MRDLPFTLVRTARLKHYQSQLQEVRQFLRHWDEPGITSQERDALIERLNHHMEDL